MASRFCPIFYHPLLQTLTLQQRFQELLKAAPSVGEHIKLAALNTHQPGPLADLVAGTLSLQLSEKQQLLDTRTQKINSADIGYDPKGKVVYVPTFFVNTVAAYELK